MATRRPLVESKRDNNVEQVVYAQREESKVSAGESIRNGLNKKSISDLKRDLDRLSSRSHETRVAKPVAEATPPESDLSALEIRLRDLVAIHHDSKIKHKARIERFETVTADLTSALQSTEEDLRATKAAMTALQKELDQLRTSQQATADSNARYKEKISKMKADAEVNRQDTKLLIGENGRLQQEIDEARASAISVSDLRQRHTEQRAEWRKDQSIMEEETRTLNRQLERAKEEIGNTKATVAQQAAELLSAEDRADHLEETLEAAVYLHGKLFANTVNKSLYEDKCVDLMRAREEIRTLRSRNSSLGTDLRNIGMEKEGLKAQLSAANSLNRDLQQMLDEVLQQRASDRSRQHPLPIHDLEPDLLDDSEDLESLCALVSGHTTLSTLYERIQQRQVLVTLQHRTKKYEQKSAEVVESQAVLARTKTELTEATAQWRLLRHEHDPCQGIVNTLRGEVLLWQSAEQELSGKHEALCEEHKRLEERARRDKEGLKRACETASRSKAAADALEEEVLELHNALEEAAQYEELYLNLREEHGVLVEQEAMAQREMDKLSQQNAEVLGHVNGDQRINYVESLRREMAITKQELVSTRHLLNKANERITNLTQETESYKAVDGLLGASTRTKVVRRVPEGSYLRASVQRRSVSGPVGRWQG